MMVVGMMFENHDDDWYYYYIVGNIHPNWIRMMSMGRIMMDE